jgi:amicoumacin kinase
MIPVPHVVLEALAPPFGTTAADLSYFGSGTESGDGIVYSYPYDGARRLLKVMAFAAETQTLSLLRLDERLRFADYMGQNGARIAYPRRSSRDTLYETTQHSGHLWVAYCMDVAPGKTPSPKLWDPSLFRNWGQTIGMMHRLTQDYPSWRAFVDPQSGKELLTWQEEWQDFYDWCQDEDVRQKWVEIKGVLDTLPVTREAFGFIHNDAHLWNLLVDGEQITLLDFDVANHHWFVTDISIALQSVLFVQTGGMDRPVYDRGRLLEFIDLFLEGYEFEYHLPPEWLNRLDVFIAYRRILMFIVMYGGISANPEELAGWKDMILTQPPVLGGDPLEC